MRLLRCRLWVLIHIYWYLATEVEGTFRVNGSTKRMRELQAAFETPPRVSYSCLPNYHTPLTANYVIAVREIVGLEEGDIYHA